MSSSTPKTKPARGRKRNEKQSEDNVKVKKVDEGGPTNLSKKENEFLLKLKQRTTDWADLSSSIISVDSSILDTDNELEKEKENLDHCKANNTNIIQVNSLIDKTAEIMKEPLPEEVTIFDSPHLTVTKKLVTSNKSSSVCQQSQSEKNLPLQESTIKHIIRKVIQPWG